jgi:hypothetical protein
MPTGLEKIFVKVKKSQNISCLCTFKPWNWRCFYSWNTENKARSASFNCRYCSAFLQRREDWPERSYKNLAKVPLLLTTDADGPRELALGRNPAQMSWERGAEEVWFCDGSLDGSLVMAALAGSFRPIVKFFLLVWRICPRKTAIIKNLVCRGHYSRVPMPSPHYWPYFIALFLPIGKR